MELDLGRKSGGGRMVSQFCELCVNIWGGCPAVESIPGGLESSEPPTSMDSGSAEGEEGDIETSEEGYPDPELSIANANKSGCIPKRSLIAHLKDARNAKLKKPLSFEKQMLQMARDNVTCKKHMLQEMKDANASHTAQMNILTNSLVNLTNALTATLHQPLHVPHPSYNLVKVLCKVEATGLLSKCMVYKST